MLCYITCYFMLYNMLFYVYVILYLTIIPGGHVGYEMIALTKMIISYC